MVEGLLGHPCTKFCRIISNRSAAVRRRRCSSKDADREELEDGGLDLMMSTAADGPLACVVSGRDRLASGNTSVDVPEVWTCKRYANEGLKHCSFVEIRSSVLGFG